MGLDLVFADKYFATARERYAIMLRRNAGEPKPWTEDWHFRNWRFCQVHREDDRTTEWFRDNVRSKLSGLKAVEATVIFRWFNRIETGQIILDMLLDEWNTVEARARLTGVSPIVTGAYIIKAGDGVSKLEGILNCIDQARPMLAKMWNNWQSWKTNTGQLALQTVWKDLTTVPFLGGFMAYEIVSDLRWVDFLLDAPDIRTWANAGPGCARGLGWVVAGDSSIFSCSPAGQRVMLPLMQTLLGYSELDNYWPEEWKPWEMREVEHWCCEYDKYMRAATGDSLKRKFDGGY